MSLCRCLSARASVNRKRREKIARKEHSEELARQSRERLRQHILRLESNERVSAEQSVHLVAVQA